VLIDSYRFLPRAFRGRYEQLSPLAGDDQPVWAPSSARLADARISLLSSAGLYLTGKQEPFDADRERREPTWGDPSWRRIPQDVAPGELGMSHLHVNPADVMADHNVTLPTQVLAELISDGTVGEATEHVSVMGYQQEGLERWRTHTGPEIIEMLRAQGSDGVVLVPV
jgi:hypothetical protein